MMNFNHASPGVKTNSMAQQGGFTLIEVAISIGLSLFVLMVGLSIQTMFYQESISINTRSKLAIDSRLTIEALSQVVRQAGGSSVRPWAAIWVEDNCQSRDGLPDCNGSDRLTVARRQYNLAECPIMTSGTITSSSSSSFSIQSPNGAGGCCLVPEMERQQAIVSQGNFHANYFIDSIVPQTCTAILTAGQIRDKNTGTLNTWTGATISPVIVETYFVDRADNKLNIFIDANGNALADSNEIQEMAFFAEDLQIAMGYDFAVPDGDLSSDGAASDEWLYNSPGAPEALGADYFLNASISDLRMIQIDVLFKSDKNATFNPLGTSLRMLNGPERDLAGKVSEAISQRVYPRSNNIIF